MARRRSTRMELWRWHGSVVSVGRSGLMWSWSHQSSECDVSDAGGIVNRPASPISLRRLPGDAVDQLIDRGFQDRRQLYDGVDPRDAFGVLQHPDLGAVEAGKDSQGLLAHVEPAPRAAQVRGNALEDDLAVADWLAHR